MISTTIKENAGIKRFLVYGTLGWAMEIIWTGLSSLVKGDLTLVARTSLWMFPIYGMAILLEPIHHRIREWSWPLRGMVWLLLIWGMEYVTGSIIYMVTGSYPWLYTGRYAVDGLIRLDYAPEWFAAGLVFERIHKALHMFGL